MKRRRLLALGAATIPAAVAGCAGTDSTNGGSDDNPSDGSDSESDNGTEADQSTPEDNSETWTEPDWPTGPYADYDSTIVEVHDEDGTVLGQVKAAVAHPGEQWTLGLSSAESMPENGGMLFESNSESDLTFWMRNMDFGLDIVYVGADRQITSIHHAPDPGSDTGTEEQYQFSGTGQYVLEVNYMWTSERGISTGDELVFEL